MANTVSIDDCFKLTKGAVVPGSEFFSVDASDLNAPGLLLEATVTNLKNILTIPSWQDHLPGDLLTPEKILQSAHPTPSRFHTYTLGLGYEIILPSSIETGAPVSSMTVQLNDELAEMPIFLEGYDPTKSDAVAEAQLKFLQKWFNRDGKARAVSTDNDQGHCHHFRMDGSVFSYHRVEGMEFYTACEREFDDAQGNSHAILCSALVYLNPLSKDPAPAEFHVGKVRVVYRFQPSGSKQAEDETSFIFVRTRGALTPLVLTGHKGGISSGGIEMKFDDAGELESVSGKLTRYQLRTMAHLGKIDYSDLISEILNLDAGTRGMPLGIESRIVPLDADG